MWNLRRNDTNELTKQRLMDLENEPVVAGVVVEGAGIVGEFGPLWEEVKVTQSCPTLCDPMNYTVSGIL